MILLKHSVTADLAHIAFFVAVLFLILNSLFNPLIYGVRLRHFRVAFIQLLSRKTNPEAKQLERRIFGPRRVGVVATLNKNFEH